MYQTVMLTRSKYYDVSMSTGPLLQEKFIREWCIKRARPRFGTGVELAGARPNLRLLEVCRMRAPKLVKQKQQTALNTI